jgi:uncharacterized protein YbjT (DUF2867 family)
VHHARMSKLVCVTGATGYVGAYVVKELLARGYRVRATVRDPSDTKKAAHLTALPRAVEALELSAGDLERQGSFDEALRGCDLVVHTASAVTLAAKDPQREIVDVAVNGAKNVLSAAVRAKVSRVVLTSSVAAVAGEDRPLCHLFTEADWNETATVKSDAYGLSKVLAERAGREIARDAGLTMVSILPSLVLGPVMTAQHLRTSPAVLFEVMSGKWPGVPDLLERELRDAVLQLDAGDHELLLEADESIVAFCSLSLTSSSFFSRLFISGPAVFTALSVTSCAWSSSMRARYSSICSRWSSAIFCSMLPISCCSLTSSSNRALQPPELRAAERYARTISMPRRCGCRWSLKIGVASSRTTSTSAVRRGRRS